MIDGSDYENDVLENPLDQPLSPFLVRKREEVISEGHPQTPGNPDPSGLHTPFFIGPLGAFLAGLKK